MKGNTHKMLRTFNCKQKNERWVYRYIIQTSLYSENYIQSESQEELLDSRGPLEATHTAVFPGSPRKPQESASEPANRRTGGGRPCAQTPTGRSEPVHKPHGVSTCKLADKHLPCLKPTHARSRQNQQVWCGKWMGK